MNWHWYWFHFRARRLPVVVHLDKRPRLFMWSRIHGLQMGDWFIGVIKGREK